MSEPTVAVEGRLATNRCAAGADLLADWTAVAAIVSLALIVVAVTADASGRYLFSAPIHGVQAYVEGLLQPAVVFLGASLVGRIDGHMRVSLLTLQRWPRLQSWRARCFAWLTTAFWAACAYQAFARAWEAHVLNQWPVGEIAVPIVVSYGLTGTGCAIAAYVHLFAPRIGNGTSSH